MGILLLSLGVAACSKGDNPPTTTGTGGGTPSIGSAFAQREALRAGVEGTTWLWGEENVQVRLDKDGTAHNDIWDSKGLVTLWEPIDRRTVLLRVDKGRDNDRYAVMCFSEDLQEYDGWDFLPNKRLPRNHKK
ncbi:MAG TPA: hypothetical protein VHM90_16810 [Phycisphaerae bacterium]|nr:hypothetical protein [Phycisphaerae bacterium]